MHFLYPSFLFALLSLAIPVIVHLFNFRRYQKVQFSNVQFLKQLQEQQASRRNLKERLILACRLLALFFLVMAFARPVLSGSDNATSGRQNVVSIFVDNSYSMQTLAREGNLLDQARQKAKEIASAYGLNDRFQLLTQDFEGRHQRLLSRDEFNDAVDEIKISAQSRKLNQINQRQLSLLNEQRDANRAVYLITDFQRNMAAPVEAKDVTVNLVHLQANKLPNVAVDSVWLLSAVHKAGEQEKLVVRLHNYASEEALNIPLKLFINGSQKALGSFSIAPGKQIMDTLTFSDLKPGWQNCELQLQDNPVTFDNNFYFTFRVKQQMPVLLIDGGQPNTFLQAAFNTDAFFKADRKPEGNVDYSGLSNYPLIVLSDVQSVSAGLARQLTEYVKHGGTLAVFPAGEADIASYRALLQPMQAAWPVGLADEQIKVAGLNLQSPVFKGIFDTPPHDPDLPQVKRYFKLNNNAVADALMWLPGRQPFWQGNNYGNGRVYISAVPLNDEFSNLQRHGLFVPVLFRIALLSGKDMPLFYTIGANEAIETVPLRWSEKQVVELKKDGTSIIPDVRQQGGGTWLYLPGQLQQTGIYQLSKGDSTAALLAFNDSRSESDLSYLTAEETDKLVKGDNKNMFTGKHAANNMITQANNGAQLWKLCIILALIFLAAEIAVIRFYRADKFKGIRAEASTQTTH